MKQQVNVFKENLRSKTQEWFDVKQQLSAAQNTIETLKAELKSKKTPEMTKVLKSFNERHFN